MTKTSVFVAGGSWPGTYSAATIPIIGAINTLYTSGQEVRTQTKIQTSLTLRNLYLHITGNTVTTSRTFSIRKNAVNGNLNVIVPASTTGTFEDTSHNDTFVQNDLVNLRVTAGTVGNTTIYAFSVTAEHADTMTSYLGAFGACTVAKALTRYFAPSGVLLANSTEEDIDHVLRFAATVSFLRAYVYTNTVSAASTGYVRKNCGVANGTISIPASTTGEFVDVTNSDSFVAGNSIGYMLTTGATGTQMIMSTWGAQIQSSDDCFPLWCETWTTSLTPPSTYYWPIAGQPLYGYEADCQSKLRTTNTLENLFATISQNSVNNATTIKTRVDGGYGTLAVSVPGSTTGEFEDTGNTDTVTSTTLIDYEVNVAGGGGGSVTITQAGVDASATVKVKITDSGDGSETPTSEASFTLTETGSGSETLAALSSSFTIGETGAGADAVPDVTSSFSISDTGGDSEFVDIFSGGEVLVFDSGAGADSFVEVETSFTDSGSGVDVLFSVETGISDAGTGTDSLSSLEASLTVSDVGAGSEAWSISSSFTVTDVGSGAEVLGITATLPAVTDSGVGSDSIASISASFTLSDTGLGADSVASISVTLTMSDTGVGADSLAGINVSLTVSDANAAATEVWTIAVLQNAYDAGTGADLPGITANVSYSDTSAGADVWTIQGQVFPTDTGTGADVIINITHPVTDSGVAVEAAVYPSMTGTFSDSAVAVELPKINFTVTDSGALSAEVAYKLEITPISATDSGTLLSEAIWTAVDVLVQQLAKGAEFGWRQKGVIAVDDFEPPHVLSIKIADEAKISDQKIEGGMLPQRKMRGKIGRTVEITGWTESQSDIDTMETLTDGATRVFQHPCGDSFSVIAVGLQVKRSVQRVDRRDYTWMLGESIR